MTSNYVNSSAMRSMSNNRSKTFKNLQAYTFGGITHVAPSDPNANSLESGYDSGREVLTGFGQSQTFSQRQAAGLTKPQKPKNPNFFEQAYGMDHKKMARQRPQTCKSGYMKRPSTVDKIRGMT